MLKDPDIRKGLLVSLITSVLVLIFIDPLLKWTANWLMTLGNSMATSWVNGIYLSAALGLREKFSFLILALGGSLLSGLTTGIFVGRMLVRNAKAKELLKRNRWFVVADTVFALLFLGSCFSTLATNFAELQLVASFNQRVTVLAARASDQQVKDLRAAWALMQNRKDYEAINLEIHRLAKEHSAKLPPPLWE